MTYQQAKIKFAFERIIMWPFVFAGKVYGRLIPLKTKHTHFLFFSSADIGGAPRVNIDITNSIRQANPLIIFSKKPKNNEFIEDFKIKGVRIIDLHKYIDNKLYHFVNLFFRGAIVSWISNNPNAVIFGGECLFFYKILPHVKKNVKRVELSHLPTWLKYNIGLVDKIDLRIQSTKRLQQEIIEQYKFNQIGEEFYHKLLFFDNAIDIPPYTEINNKELEIVFIGRGAPQKRVFLSAAIAQRMHEEKLPAHFSFVGNIENSININDFPFCKFYGNIKDDTLMKDIYQNSDVLILTSSYEGLPLVVMQMMAHGKVVLSTAVNGIPDYIKHLENGLLIIETEETKIVEQGVTFLKLLLASPSLKQKLGRNSYAIAQKLFNKETFYKNYQDILIYNKLPEK